MNVHCWHACTHRHIFKTLHWAIHCVITATPILVRGEMFKTVSPTTHKCLGQRQKLQNGQFCTNTALSQCQRYSGNGTSSSLKGQPAKTTQRQALSTECLVQDVWTTLRTLPQTGWLSTSVWQCVWAASITTSAEQWCAAFVAALRVIGVGTKTCPCTTCQHLCCTCQLQYNLASGKQCHT